MAIDVMKPVTTRSRRFRRLLAGSLCALLSVALVLVVAGVWWRRSHDFAAVVERAGGRFKVHQSGSLFGNVMDYVFNHRAPQTLHWVTFEDTDVGDWLAANREELSRLSDLTLMLTDCPVTDAQLSPLNGLQNIFALDLSGTQVTDAALDDVLSLKSLRQLYISNTQITGAGLAQLPQSPWLAALGIDSTQATDAGVSNLASCRRLHQVSLVDATDDALSRVTTLNGLQSLYVKGPAPSAASIPDLSRMSNLKGLTLIDSSLADEDYAEIQRTLPGCTVQRFTLEQLKEMERALE